MSNRKKHTFWMNHQLTLSLSLSSSLLPFLLDRRVLAMLSRQLQQWQQFPWWRACRRLPSSPLLLERLTVRPLPKPHFIATRERERRRQRGGGGETDSHSSWAYYSWEKRVQSRAAALSLLQGILISRVHQLALEGRPWHSGPDPKPCTPHLEPTQAPCT
jgi:hypothetical protein